MKYIVIDNGEALDSFPDIDEAIDYIKDCKHQHTKQNDDSCHKYIIKEQGAKAKPKAPSGKTWQAIALVWSIPAWILGFLWGIVWFFIKLLAKILAYIITSCFKLFLFGIQACIFIIIGIIAIKSNVMD